MTTVNQIITDIDRRYPNTYTFNDKISWINDTLKTIYKDLGIENFYSFETIAGQRIYKLPTDCTIDLINSVEISSDLDKSDNVNFISLTPKLNSDVLVENSFYAGIDETTIGLYPIPDTRKKVNLYYRKIPNYVAGGDDVIEIDDRYTDLVKYNVLSIICMSGNNPDIEMANQYIMLYNNLVQEANQSKYEHRQKYPKIKIATGRRLSRRRRG